MQTKQEHERQLNEDILYVLLNEPMTGYREIADRAGVSVNKVVAIARQYKVGRKVGRKPSNVQLTLPGVL